MLALISNSTSPFDHPRSTIGLFWGSLEASLYFNMLIKEYKAPKRASFSCKLRYEMCLATAYEYKFVDKRLMIFHFVSFFHSILLCTISLLLYTQNAKMPSGAKFHFQIWLDVLFMLNWIAKTLFIKKWKSMSWRMSRLSIVRFLAPKPRCRQKSFSSLTFDTPT